MKITSCSLLAMIATCAAGAAHADGKFAITVGGGSPGATIEGQYAVTDNFQIRGGVNYFGFDAGFDSDNNSYSGEFEFSGGGLFGDFHPFGNSFFVSGGAFLGTKNVGLMIESGENLVINGVTYTPAQYGTVIGDADYQEIAPFIGLGFDTTFTSDNPWGFHALAGAAFFGSGDVSMMATGGTLSNDPIITNEVDEQEMELEQDIEDYQVYPIIQLGISYKF